MSHFTTLSQAQIRSPEAFIAAARELGFDGALTRNTEIKDYMRTTHKVDLAISTGRYDIALAKNASGKYDMVADWWGVRQELPQKMRELNARSELDIQQALLRTTTKHDLVATYRRQGFLAHVQEDAEHNISVTLTR